ncbi:hypothetical protein CROQUDRAFT_8504, partial [Cronartium quercuum f. sp. fusiforme G11]
APVGQHTVHLNQVPSSSQYSMLPAISISGLVAVHVQEAGVKQQDFEPFLEHDLLPMMNPWPASDSVLVMDNAPIHHDGDIEDLCK